MSKSSTRKDLWYLPVYAFTLGILTLGVAGCHKTNPTQDQNATATQATDDTQDPAEQANLAPVDNTTQQAAQQTAPPPPADETSSTQPAANDDYSYNAVPADDASVAEPVTYAADPPPPLPEYDQPECPGPDYMWTPGYWGYAPTGYYWVPGTWVIAPYTGALWTPGYWGFYGGRYGWHHGYWGPHIGFYGGVNYGFGYIGVGYVGGYWNNGGFMYNTSVTRVNTTIVRNVYSHNVRIVNNTRVSYNGGHGGLAARPLAAERVAAQERHTGPLPEQVSHMRQASTNRAQFASVNHGRPATLVAAHPLATNRRAPAAMPANVREQVQHENVARPVAGRPATEARPETRSARPEARPAARPEAKPEAGRTEARPETRPAARPEARPETRPAARPEARPETRPAARPEARPAAKPESRSAPRAAARPEQHEQPHANDDRKPKR
jgi:hypothetical protein